MRYINADLAIKKTLNDKDKLFALRNTCITLSDNEVNGCQNYVYDRILNLLNTQPTADVKEVVRAEWIFDTIAGLPKCSLCGKRCHSGVWFGENEYCGHCGATMDLKESLYD
mgnify:FL=1